MNFSFSMLTEMAKILFRGIFVNIILKTFFMKYLNKTKQCVILILVAAFSIFSASCNKDDDMTTPTPPVVKPDIVFYAISNTNMLHKFNANSSELPISSVSVTGLQAGETILGIDFRPATGELYGIGSTSRLYIINPATGTARQAGTTPFTPALTGSGIGIDFNPTVDRLRVVGSDGQNLRINPETGAVAATDLPINGAAGASVNAVAYMNNTAGSGSTVLFDIDITTKKLYKQLPPNDGTLVAVGDLGVPATGMGGFDINPDGSVALATFMVSGETGLYRIDTLSGKATKLGGFGTLGTSIVGIAIPTREVAYAVDDANNLMIINPLSSATPVITKAITGLAAAENVVGIDFRPLNGQLYALGSTSRIYTINLSTGGATAVGTAGAFTLSGTSFGFDFNPVVDRIRIVSNTGQNLRIEPATGILAATDASLNPGTPDVSAAAYINNFAGATTTTLFVIDGTTDQLYTQIPPNNGTLIAVGALGINVEAANGFDVGSTSGTAYAILKIGTASALYRINLTTGAASKLYDFSASVRGFSVGLGF